jgi:hypothetical protein
MCHLTFIFIHASHEEFSLWQSKMSTSSVRMCMGWHRPYGGVPFLISPTSPLETKEHVPQISEEESGVQTVLQKQIVKPLYWW